MGLYQRKDSPFWWMRLEKTGRRMNTGIPVGEGPARRDNRLSAQQIYDAAMGDIARQRFKLPAAVTSITFRQHATWYQTNVASHHKGARRAVSIIKGLVRHFGDRLLTEIDPAEIEEWKTARAKIVQRQTVNRELDLLKPLLQSAVPKYLETSPAAGVHRFPTRRFVPVTVLSESAEDALLAVASPRERAFVLLGLDALLRLGDVRTFRAEQNHGTYLEIPDPKTGVPYKVPASVRLQAALEAIVPLDGFYFANLQRRGPHKGHWRPISEATAFGWFKDLCTRAGVTRGRDVAGVTYHSLRHTGASRASRVVKPTAVMKLGGWSSLRQLARYDHPDESDLLRAVEAIGSRQRHAGEQKQQNPPKSGRVSGHKWRGRRDDSPARKVESGPSNMEKKARQDS